MSMKKRYLEHMKAKGALPEGFDCGGGMASGGRVNPDEDQWEDESWNDHDDTSGEPEKQYMAEGGEVEPSIWQNIKSNLTTGSSAENKGWGSYAKGGKVASLHDQEDDGVSDEEVQHHLAQSLMRRKQLRGISR